MAIHSFTTGLLADMDGFGFLIFFVVAFFSWLMNTLSPKDPNKKNPRRPQNAGGDRGKKVQSEIDRFLQQAREMVDSTNQERGRQDAPFRTESQTRSAPPPERRRRSPQENRQAATSGSQNPKKPKSQPALKQQKKNPSPSTLADRHLMPTNLVSTIGATPVMPVQVTGHGGKLSADSVFEKSLTQTSALERNNETLTHRNSAALDLARKMRTPLQVRDAIMMNEILNRPLALRQRGKSGRSENQFP